MLVTVTLGVPLLAFHCSNSVREMDTELYTIGGNTIRFANGASVTFAYPVGQSLLFGDVLVVQLEIPLSTTYNENIFGIDLSGTIVWQISPCYPETEDGRFGGLHRHGDLVAVSNYRGLLLYLNPHTGEVCDRKEQRN